MCNNIGIKKDTTQSTLRKQGDTYIKSLVYNYKRLNEWSEGTFYEYFQAFEFEVNNQNVRFPSFSKV